jgi:hypothetical protein
MSQWAIDVRYPGVPDTNFRSVLNEDPDTIADLGSMTVDGNRTTLHMHVEASDAHAALETGMRAADRIAMSLGLAIGHAYGVTELLHAAAVKVDNPGQPLVGEPKTILSLDLREPGSDDV